MSDNRVTSLVTMSASRVTLLVKIFESRVTLPVKMSESGVRFLFQGWKRRAELCTYIAHRCQSSEITYSVHSEFQRIHAGI